MAHAQSVLPRSEDFGVHDVIDPRDTRPILCDWVEEVQPAIVEHAKAGAPRYSIRP